MSDGWGSVKMLVFFLLALQAVSVVLMWSLDPVGQRSQASFALLLAADLVSFSIISYLARSRIVGGGVRRSFVLMGSAATLLFMFLAMLG